MLAENFVNHPVQVEHTAPTTVTPQHAEDLLQASRRLDWRFLLPDPRLERVAYIGPQPSTLATSLKIFASTLKVINATEVHDADYTHYDIVVVSNPVYQQLRLATDLVKPGGFLYIEACGRFSSARQFSRSLTHFGTKRKRLWSPQDYVAVLKGLRIDEAQAYWFWPNWEACTKIFPLGNPTVLDQAFGLQRQSTGLKSRLMTSAKRWFMHSSLLDKVIPYFGIVAR